MTYSILCDIWMFAKATNISIRKNWKYVIIFIIQFVTLILNNITLNIVVIENIVEIFLFYILFHKNDKKLIIGIAFAIPIANLLIDIISSILLSFLYLKNQLIASLAIRVILLTIMVLLWKKYAYRVRNQLNDRYKNIFLYLLIYIYISFNIISLIYVYNPDMPAVWMFFSIVLFLQVFFVVWIYRTLIRIQNQLMTRQQQNEREEKQRQLEEYTKYLEDSEDDLRKFRHDYRNVLNSLKVSAQEGDGQEVVRKLDKYTNSNLNAEALLKYKDVNHIHVKSLKSIIITKLSEIYNLKIPYNFECRGSVKKLSANIDELDLVRILGIAFDNAIEESKIMKELFDQHKSTEKAKIQIMAYSDGPDNFEFEIRNRVHKDQKISTSKIQEQGFTTKKGHQGYGLANIRQLEEKYPDMSVSYIVQDGWFDFYMVIDTEEGDEDND